METIAATYCKRFENSVDIVFIARDFHYKAI